MPLQDGPYDIISRKYSVPLGADEIQSPHMLVSAHCRVVRIAFLCQEDRPDFVCFTSSCIVSQPVDPALPPYRYVHRPHSSVLSFSINRY